MPRHERRSGPCQICNALRQSLHREHIIPRWKGGGEESENIQWICANCHEDKTRLDLKGAPGPNLGKKFSAESRAKMSSAQIGRPPTKGFTGRRHTPETLAKMSALGKGRTRNMPPHTEEHKKKISKGLKKYHADNGKPIRWLEPEHADKTLRDLGIEVSEEKKP